MKEKKNKIKYDKLERLEIAVSIAKALTKGSTLVKECKVNGISRMALWFWMDSNPQIKAIISEAMEDRKEFLKNRREHSPSAKSDVFNRPKGWRKDKSRPLTEKEAEKMGYVAVCHKCGYEWKPRGYPVTKCGHHSCQSRCFMCSNRFSDSEKRAAREKRENHARKRALKEDVA